MRTDRGRGGGRCRPSPTVAAVLAALFLTVAGCGRGPTTASPDPGRPSPSDEAGERPLADLGSGGVPLAAAPPGLPPAGPEAVGVEAEAPAPPPSTAATEQWVVSYYTGYNIGVAPIERIHWSSMTHIAFGAVGVDDQGRVGVLGSVKGGEASARAVAEAARANGVVPLLMVGGQGTGAAMAPLIDADPDAFAAAVIDQVDRLGYAGLDFNWEDGIETLPGDDDLARHARFRQRTLDVLRAIRSRRPDLVITYPTLTINPNYHPKYDPAFLPAVAEAVDRIGIMSYGYGGVAVGAGWGSGFSSPLDGEGGGDVPYPISIEQTLATYVADGVPAPKLAMGVGSYALCYDDAVTGPRQGTGAGPSGRPPLRPLAELFAADGPLALAGGARVWDADAAQPYLAPGDGAALAGYCGHASRFLSYDDEESLVAKGDWSRRNGYGGTIVWEYADLVLPEGAVDGRSPTALLDALAQGFLG